MTNKTISRTPMTNNGFKLLREEIKKAKQERHKASVMLAEASSHGDLKENAEYHAAKEAQGLLEARILDIENKLSCAQIVDISKVTNNGKVIFSSTVTIVNENGGMEKYQIVGEDEAKTTPEKISINSPIARSMIGKQQGDVIEFEVCDSKIVFEIEKVSYV